MTGPARHSVGVGAGVCSVIYVISRQTGVCVAGIADSCLIRSRPRSARGEAFDVRPGAPSAKEVTTARWSDPPGLMSLFTTRPVSGGRWANAWKPACRHAHTCIIILFCRHPMRRVLSLFIRGDPGKVDIPDKVDQSSYI